MKPRVNTLNFFDLCTFLRSKHLNRFTQDACIRGQQNNELASITQFSPWNQVTTSFLLLLPFCRSQKVLGLIWRFQETESESETNSSRTKASKLRWQKGEISESQMWSGAPANQIKFKHPNYDLSRQILDEVRDFPVRAINIDESSARQKIFSCNLFENYKHAHMLYFR